ncbi:unnamed protein product [Adineta ricciae]|uniref:CUB domain-containing protein n=1 Tax=Adineta ricciae TaxID=249248 RepID=A0A813NX68_ADIRI|nr:unnamed protein product [Adineta ricciae]CAF1300422.1 unnamed protein product [Adineta ricciae]
MLICLRTSTCDVLHLLLLVSLVSICITKAASTVPSSNNENNNNNLIRRPDEYVMTSVPITGLKRSNVCGDGYRIEGALLMSHSYSKSASYSPYEDCYMTFKARRANNQIRIRILSLDLNDIHGGVNCLDALRFYKSAYINREDRLNTVECGQLTGREKINVVSPTGIVTAHFSTDGGNVSGLGFKVVLTAFRSANKTDPCDELNDEFLCNNQECISNLLLCDGVPHCLDGSDESPYRLCTPNTAESSNTESNSRSATSKRPHWRGILIAAFLLIILSVFILFVVYFLCSRCVRSPAPLMKSERKNYATILNSPKNGPKTATTTQIVIENNKSTSKRLDEDYSLL